MGNQGLLQNAPDHINMLAGMPTSNQIIALGCFQKYRILQSVQVFWPQFHRCGPAAWVETAGSQETSSPIPGRHIEERE